MNNAIKRKKGGFSLMECIIALLLFSIVMGSVVVAFTTSHKQAGSLNENYKADLIVGNILSAYEGCNDIKNFVYMMNNFCPEMDVPLYVDLEDSEQYSSFERGVEIQGEGEGGKYSFNPNSVPKSINYDHILVKDNKVHLQNSANEDILVLEGDFPDNALQNEEDGYRWGTAYTESSMTLTGKTHIDAVGVISEKTKFSYPVNLDAGTTTLLYTNAMDNNMNNGDVLMINFANITDGNNKKGKNGVSFCSGGDCF